MDDTSSLQDRLQRTLVTGRALAPAPWLFPTVLRLLARGVPVAVGDVAAATRRNLAEVRAAIEDVTDIELDEEGRIVGYGLTLRPTRHRFEVGGKALYTWCALDTLMFPALLGDSAVVQSPSPLSAAPVRVEVGPDGVRSVDPADAMVSIVTPDEGSAVRASFCDHVHYFASTAEGQEWVAQHPTATVVPVEEAFRLGSSMAQQLELAAGPGPHDQEPSGHGC